jgi:hypothetical protein
MELGLVSGVDSDGRTIWIADAHRGDGQRFVVRADEKLTGFLEFESAVRRKNFTHSANNWSKFGKIQEGLGTVGMKAEYAGILAAICWVGVLLPRLANASENTVVTTADRISLFKVPLQCPAAPQIGCGSAAKPILLELERETGVAEAWLNRVGTTLAVVWKPKLDAQTRSNVVAKLKEDHATEIQGESRGEALKEGFLVRQRLVSRRGCGSGERRRGGYYRCKISSQSGSKDSVVQGQAQRLQLALVQSFRKCLTSGQQESCRPGDIARKYLNPEQMKILKEAVKSGVRPLPNESWSTKPKKIALEKHRFPPFYQ